MSVITTANKAQGQAVKTFDLSPKAEAQVEAKPVVKPDPVKLKAQKVATLKTELLSLDKAERDQLLNQLFADDLKQIVKIEQQKGFEQGVKNGQDQWQDQEQMLKQKMHNEQQQLVADLKQAVRTFTDSKPVVELNDEGILLDIVYSAVLKILEVQLAEGEYVREVIHTLADEFSGQESLELRLCSRDLHILSELNLQSLLPANMTVLEDDTLLPGSYRIHIEGGAIESKLDDKLKNFKSILIETYGRRSQEVN